LGKKNLNLFGICQLERINRSRGVSRAGVIVFGWARLRMLLPADYWIHAFPRMHDSPDKAQPSSNITSST
jgi:hypothetical protein